MSTWISTSKTPPKAKVETGALDDADKAARPRQTAKIDAASLRIDDSFDFGGDPYNQTGQFVVADIKQESE